MDIDDFRYLAACGEFGTFTSAARSLGLNASTVSRRVARVEDELGVTIFERGRYGVRLTTGGRSVMTGVRRTLADFDAVLQAGSRNGAGEIGEIRLGVRMPPVGEPLHSLLADWHKSHPQVAIKLHEMNEREIAEALVERRLDAALMPKHTLWHDAAAMPLYREPVVAALPAEHPLAARESVDWASLRDETFLVQGWDESHTAREFYAFFLGSGVKFTTHPASKQSILALVGVGFGMTLATKSQAEVTFPGVAFRPIDDTNAWLEVGLVWHPESEDAVVGRFASFMRDAARSRRLL